MYGMLYELALHTAVHYDIARIICNNILLITSNKINYELIYIDLIEKL